MYLAMTSEAVLNDPANDEDPGSSCCASHAPRKACRAPRGQYCRTTGGYSTLHKARDPQGLRALYANGRKRHERNRQIEVGVVPTEGGTLIVTNSPSTYWRAIRNDTREAIIVTADDVAWVLANPVLAMSGSRGYGRMWIIRNIEGVGLDMRVEVDA